MLCLATKESYFIFNGLLNKQTDGVAMGSPFGPSLANTFLSYDEKNWSTSCPQGFKPVFYWPYVDIIFVLFKSNDRLKHFQELLFLVISTCPFLWRQKDKTNFPFLILKLFANKVNFQPQSIVNLLLVVCIVTLEVSYFLFKNLIWYTPWFTDVFVFARVEKSSMQN